MIPSAPRPSLTVGSNGASPTAALNTEIERSRPARSIPATSARASIEPASNSDRPGTAVE